MEEIEQSEAKKKARSEALHSGAYYLTQELYESLKRGDVVILTA